MTTSGSWGPPSQGQRLGGQPLGLVQAAGQQLLPSPEQRHVPGEVELPQGLGGPVVVLQAASQGGQVTLLQLVGQQEAAASQGHHPVAGGLGQLHHLGGHGQAFPEVVGPPGGHVVLVEHGRQRDRVAHPPGPLRRPPVVGPGRLRARRRPSGPRPAPAAARSVRPRRAGPGAPGRAAPAGSDRRPPRRPGPSSPGRRPAWRRRRPGRPGPDGPPGRSDGPARPGSLRSRHRGARPGPRPPGRAAAAVPGTAAPRTAPRGPGRARTGTGPAGRPPAGRPWPPPGVEDLVGWQAGDAGDHVEVEVAALDRRRGQAGVGGVREPPRRSVGVGEAACG